MDPVGARPVSSAQFPASEAGVVGPQERIELVVSHLGTRRGGLSTREAQRRSIQSRQPDHLDAADTAGKVLGSA